MSHEIKYERDWAKLGLKREDVLECLDVLARELKVGGDELQPTTALDKYLVPPKTRNPLRWLMNQVRWGDKQSELSYLLEKHLSDRDLVSPRERLHTIEDYVLAWCGVRR